MNKKAFRFISLVLCAVMALGTLTGVSFAAQDFPDASRSQWYGEAVYHCVDKGYVSGYDDGTFRPGDPITYAQLATMLRGGVYADTSYAEETFPGKPWWYPGVYTCRQTGALEGVKADVVTGDSDINTPVTRYEMAQIVSNVMESQGLAVPGAETAVGEYIADWSSIPVEYQDAVANCYALDIITGYPDGSFGGDETLTRAQVCVVLAGMDNAFADAQPDTSEARPQPSGDINADDDALADAPAALLPIGGAAATTTTTTPSDASETKVAYGKTKYPSLSNVDYDTYRKLDYREREDKYTYFYDFRDSWYAACDSCEAPTTPPFIGYSTSIRSNSQGFWGVYASTKDNTLTYEVYSYLDHVTVSGVEFRSYDDAKAIVLDDTPNVEHVRKTDSLANGPYALCVWFDYTHGDGTVKTIGTWQTLYVSDGHGWFADYAYSPDDATFKIWLAEERPSLMADDFFQNWVAKQGGNNFDKATDVSVIHYPFKSGTSRYPDNSGKWRQLAHEICPDEDTNDYLKAGALFAWMQSNIAYDKDVPLDGEYRWAEAAATGSAKGYTMWDSHLGMCEDFSNVYAIMCRELGIPCHVVSVRGPSADVPGHAFNTVYLNDRWEIVDVNTAIRKAYVGKDNKAYAANVEAYWAKQEAKGVHEPAWSGFCDTALSKFMVASYETDKHTDIIDKMDKRLEKLNNSLFDAAYYSKWSGTIYGH